MEEPIHKGILPPVDLPPRLRFSAGTGYSKELRKKILTETAEAELGAYAAEGFDVTIDPRDDTPFSELVATIKDPSGGGTSQNPTATLKDTWELTANKIERDVWSVPAVQGELNKLIGNPSSHELTLFVHRLIEDKVAGKKTTLDDVGNTVPLYGKTPGSNQSIYANYFTGMGLNATVFLNLAQSMGRGFQSYWLPAWVVKRSTLLTPNTSIKPVIDLVGKIISDEYLTSTQNPPATLTFILPSGFYQVQTPTMTQQSDGNWLLQQEWWWADFWDPWIYTYVLA